MQHGRKQSQQHGRSHVRVGQGDGGTFVCSGGGARAGAGSRGRRRARVAARAGCLRVGARVGTRAATAAGASGVGGAGSAGRVRSSSRVGVGARRAAARGGCSRRRVIAGRGRAARVVRVGRVAGLDVLVRTAGVRELVAVGGRVVDDLDGFDVHGERSLAVVGPTTSPLDSTLAVVRVTTGPDTQTQLHGGLGETRATLGVSILDGPDGVAIDNPADGILGPVDSVGVDVFLRVVHVLPGLAIVSGSVTLSKVVGLNLVRVTANSFLLFPLASNTMYAFHCLGTYPVNLIQVIRLHDYTTDDTSAWGRLHLNLHVTEHEVVLGLDGGRITLLGDGEGSALIIVLEIASSHLPAVEGTVTLGEVRVERG